MTVWQCGSVAVWSTIALQRFRSLPTSLPELFGVGTIAGKDTFPNYLQEDIFQNFSSFIVSRFSVAGICHVTIVNYFYFKNYVLF